MRINFNNSTIISNFESFRIAVGNRFDFALATLKEINWTPQMGPYSFKVLGTNEYTRYVILTLVSSVICLTVCFFLSRRASPTPADDTQIPPAPTRAAPTRTNAEPQQPSAPASDSTPAITPRMELLQKLCENPELCANFEDQMIEHQITQNDVYQNRWQKLKLEEILKLEGKEFPALLTTPITSEFTQQLLLQTAHLSAGEIIHQCPELFRKFIFNNKSSLGGDSLTFRQRLEKTTLDYEQMAALAKAFGAGFYNRDYGFFSQKFVESVTVIYVYEKANAICTKPIAVDTIDQLPYQVRTAFGTLTGQVAAKKEQITRQIAMIERRAGDAVAKEAEQKNLRTEYSAFVSDKVLEFQNITKSFADIAKAFLAVKQSQ